MIHAISSQYQSIIMSLFLLIFSLSPSLSGLVVALGSFVVLTGKLEIGKTNNPHVGRAGW